MTLFLAIVTYIAGTVTGPGPEPFDPMPILWLELWLPLIT